MNEVIKKDNIENMIFEIRGMHVMLDSDLAKLYDVETKRINEAVKNNPSKFPERFSFVLCEEEEQNLRSKFSTSNLNSNNYGGRRYNSRVFTEQGVYMLATILKSKTAIETTINIMDAFVLMRKILSNSVLNNNILINHENRILKLENTFNRLEENTKVNTIFFEGQIYDAHSLLLDILNKSKNEIIIIDNYANKELLDILKNIDKNITIVSSNINNILKIKYEKQYNNIKFISNNTFHDRFIIIDKNKLYSCGASFKDLGKKCFAINEIESNELLNTLLKKLED